MKIARRILLTKSLVLILLIIPILSSCTLVGYSLVGISAEAHNLFGHRTKILGTINCHAPALTLILSEITTPHGMGSDSIKIVLGSTIGGNNRIIDSTYIDFGSTEIKRSLIGSGFTVPIYELFSKPNEAFKDWFVRIVSAENTQDEYRLISQCLKEHSLEIQTVLTESLNRFPSYNKKTGFRIIGTFFSDVIKPMSAYYCDANKENKVLVYATGAVLYEQQDSKTNRSSVIGELVLDTKKINLWAISLSSQSIRDYLNSCYSDNGLTIKDEYQVNFSQTK